MSVSKAWKRLNLGFIFVPKGYFIMKRNNFYVWCKDMYVSRLFTDKWDCYRHMINDYRLQRLQNTIVDQKVVNFYYSAFYDNYKIVNLGAIKQPHGTLILKTRSNKDSNFIAITHDEKASNAVKNKWKALRLCKKLVNGDGRSRTDIQHLASVT